MNGNTYTKNSPRYKSSKSPYAIKVRTHDDEDIWLPSQYSLTNAYLVKVRVIIDESEKEHIDYCIKPSESVEVKLGFFIQLLPGWEAQIRSSHEAVADGLAVLGGPYTVGNKVYNTSEEISIFVQNIINEDIDLHSEDEVAIMVVSKVPHITLAHVKNSNMHPSFKNMNGTT